MVNNDIFTAIKKYGPNLYIFDEDSFVKNYLDFENEFKSKYPKFIIAYSYKTNYTPRICELIKTLGGYAEVVSEMEYYLAKKIGYKDSNIVYNGPCKGSGLIQCLKNGGIINIDNYDEFKVIKQYVIANPKSNYEICIRCNIDVGQNFISRFGLEPNGWEFQEIIKEVNNIENLKLVGLHCHISRSRSLEAWKKRAEIMVSLAQKYIPKGLKYIDLGSGMFGNMSESMRSQFKNITIPSYKEYASEICGIFDKAFKNLPLEEKPYLIVEPGTTLINRYIYFLSKIIAIKSLRGKNFAILNGSTHNLGEVSSLKQLPHKIIKNDKNKQNEQKIYDVVGYTCLEQDCLLSNVELSIETGDWIIFENVGGYSNVLKPPFILPNFPMISIDQNHFIRLLKRVETPCDIFTTYEFEEKK